MNAIENQVRELVKVELDAANERFPQFHSQHEGYAVILEEVDELRTETGETDEFLCFLWSAINGDIIAEFEGKIDIEGNDGGYVLFDYEGKRYTYYNCFVESIAEIGE